jgi:lipopolysaccharide transport system permease protein
MIKFNIIYSGFRIKLSKFLSAFTPIWRYRWFVAGSVKREFQLKYKNSLLGMFWVIANPLAMILVYTVIFSEIMRAKLPGISGQYSYSIYICVGILAWGFFSEVTLRAQNIFIENANLIKKLSFPKLCLPAIVLLNATINFLIISSIFILFLLLSGNFPGFIFFLALPVLAVQALFSMGLGIVLGVLNVFFRDVGQLFAIVLQFWFWLTPIVYPMSIVPESVRFIMDFNPMAIIISAYQDIFVFARYPHFDKLFYMLIVSLLLCYFALSLFRKRSAEMSDEI